MEIAFLNKMQLRFFNIKIEYTAYDLCLDIFKLSYIEQLEILEKKFGVQFHLVQILETRVKFICSSSLNFDQEYELKEALIDVSENVLSVFEPKINTPIVLQWEYL